MIHLCARRKIDTLDVIEASQAKFSSADTPISYHWMLDELNIQSIGANATDDGGKVSVPPDAESYFENFIIWTLVIMAVLLVVAVALQFWNERSIGFSRLNANVQGDNVDDRHCRSGLERGIRENIDENNDEDHEINNLNYSDNIDDNSPRYDQRRPHETI